VITFVDVSPRSLPAAGGQVAIVAHANDDGGGITQVYAEVYGGEGVYLAANMPLVGSRFTGTVDIPPNWTEYDTSYQFTVYAWDLTGNSVDAYAGEVQVLGTPPFDEPPTVWDPSVAPTALPSSGGPVALSVFAQDSRGILSAEARVTSPEGAEEWVQMEPIDRADQFHGTFLAPANTTAVPRTYTVRMTAYDDLSQGAAVDGASFTVAARPALVPGTLSLSPDRRSWGKVELGTAGRKTIVLRRSTSRSTVPMTGFVTSTSPAFVLVGAGKDGVAFSLLPGQHKTLTIEFRPTAVGVQQAAMRIARADGAQPSLSARLEGQGIVRRR
jgi:hypothetical protein